MISIKVARTDGTGCCAATGCVHCLTEGVRGMAATHDTAQAAKSVVFIVGPGGRDQTAQRPQMADCISVDSYHGRFL